MGNVGNTLLGVSIFHGVVANAPTDIRLDEKAKSLHRLDSLNILVYVFLLILTVCTIWLFKLRRARFLHETGLAIIYGLLVGAAVRYGGQESEITHLRVVPASHSNSTLIIPPDSLFLALAPNRTPPARGAHTYAYIFRGEVADMENRELDQKATFDPEIFFNIILPPIIFNAGYSLKRKHFFRNLGTIMTFAFVGTTISCFVTGAVMFAFLQLMPYLEFSFTNCLYFGAIISATDPVTVLAIFHDLHVDVTLYALVFGESILNDAVAIVLSGAIDKYEEMYQTSDGSFQVVAALRSLGNFLYIFVCSFLIGSVTGCATAALTKFTRLCDFPLLESCLFVLMSYSTFLVAEAADLTGIVAVLFCGMCQAHYTHNNLSTESRTRTKQVFELLNFLAENFIFTYIGVSIFTYQKHRWDAAFIMVAFLSIAVGRAAHVYPLSFLLNLGRHHKIPYSFQHVLFFSGLRGAMAFALAIRNTLSEQRHLMLTTTSLIAIVTVIVCGGCTTQLMAWLGIQVGVEEEHELLQFNGMRTVSQVATPTELQSPPPIPEVKTPYEKAWLVRKWYNFDIKYMKPLLTHSNPTLMETLPACCLPLARIFTSTRQMTHEESHEEDDSDLDICIDESDMTFGNHSVYRRQPERCNSAEEGDLGLSECPLSTTRVSIPGHRGDAV